MNGLIEESNLSAKSFRQIAKTQMMVDLRLLLAAYNNQDIGLRLVSKRMEVSERTLRRLIEDDSYPQDNTIMRFYSYFFSIYKPQCDNHEIIRTMLNKLNAIENGKLSTELEDMLRKNKVFRDIFFYSRTGKITKNWVVTKYGKYGLQLIELMLARNVLSEVDKNVYSAGILSISKGPKTLKVILNDLIESYLDTEKLSMMNQNSAFYNIEGLNDKGKIEVLKLMQVFKNDVQKILSNEEYQGDNRMFVMGVTDTLDELQDDNLIQ